MFSFADCIILKTKYRTSMSYKQERDVGIQACLQAARLCERVRSTIPEVMEKSDDSPVTVRRFIISTKS